jgi:hypothetical protein
MTNTYIHIFKDIEGKDHELKITNTVRTPIPSSMWAAYIDNRLYLRLTTKRLLEFVYYIRKQTIESKDITLFFNTRKVVHRKNKIIYFDQVGTEPRVESSLESFKDAFSDILMDAALGLLQNDLQRKYDL